VSEDRVTEAATAAEQEKGGYPGPLLRFLPAITFGMRTAALAGLVVTAGAAAIGLTGVFDDVVAGTNTTCCGAEIDPHIDPN
jgi:hypothetical protein